MYYYAPTSATLDEIFDDELENMLGTVAADAELLVELAPGVRIAHLFNRSFEQLGARALVRLDNVSAGACKPILFELELPDAPPGELDVATVSLQYTDLSGPTPQPKVEQRGRLGVRIGTASSDAALDAVVLAQLTTFESSTAVLAASEMFTRGQHDAAQRVLDAQLAIVDARVADLAAAPDTGHLDRDLDALMTKQVELMNDSKHDFGEAATKRTEAKRKAAKNRIRLNRHAFDAFEDF